MMDNVHSIRIETNNSPIAQNWHIYLGDTDVSKFVRAISIDARVNERVVVCLECIGTLELPHDLQALIIAAKEE
jgi:hypothetical protein